MGNVKGVYNGHRLLSEDAVAEMTKPHEAGSKPIAYGLGWQCSVPGKPSIAGFSDRCFGHGGAFGTHGWIDPDKRTITILMIQSVLLKNGGVRGVFLQQLTGVAESEKR